MPNEEEHAENFSWRATEQILSDGRVRMRVVGTYDKPRIPIRVTLSRAPFQPSNPHILLLEFRAEVIGAAVAQHASAVTVAFEQTSARRYKLVSIQPGGVGVAVESSPGKA